MPNNNLSSNLNVKVIRRFLKAFDLLRTLSKGINTTLIEDQFNPSTGSTVYVKRAHQYRTVETDDGDISGQFNNIISGRAPCVVQKRLTVPLEWTSGEEALELDQLDEIVMPAASELCNKLESNLGQFMLVNSGVVSGVPGNVVSTWQDVARVGANMKSIGVPRTGNWCMAVSDHNQIALAKDQTDLGAGGVAGQLVKSAWEQAMLRERVGGMDKVFSATALAGYAVDGDDDRVGAVNGAVVTTYASVKDTMQQTIVVDGFTGALQINAGETINITGINRVNQATRELIFDENGDEILWTGVVTETVVLSSGAGSITVTPPVIFESGGQYNNTDATIADDAVINLGIDSATDKTVQPALWWEKQAFTLATVPLKRLYATDMMGVTKDGLLIRVSKYSDGDADVQKMRFDLQPAFGVMNPGMAGQAYGQVAT